VTRGPVPPDASWLLRRGILGLAGLGIAGTTIELVFLRHWGSLTQAMVWPALIVLGVALWLVWRRPTRRRIVTVRAFSVAILAVAVIGVALHFVANFDAGPLDRAYALSWASLPVVQQWFLAATDTVGPAPVLAPGALAEISLALLVGTIAHPALALT
jgi:hypothetical protein